MTEETITEAEKRREEFGVATRPLIKWLNDNGHAHTKIIITTDSAELVEGIRAYVTDDYIRG